MQWDKVIGDESSSAPKTISKFHFLIIRCWAQWIFKQRAVSLFCGANFTFLAGSGHLMVPNQWCFANLLFYLALRVTNSSNSSWPDLLKINWDYTMYNLNLFCVEKKIILPIITCPRQDPSQLMPTRPCSWRNPSCSRLCLNQKHWLWLLWFWVTLKGEGKGISNS